MEKAMTLAGPLGRLLLCVMFLLAGLNKIADPHGTIEYIAAHGLPFPPLAYAVALAVELGGGLLILIGYQTRIVAAGMAVFCIVTALGFHNNFADQMQMTNFLKNIAIAGGFLQLVAHGAGAWSVDNRRA